MGYREIILTITRQQRKMLLLENNIPAVDLLRGSGVPFYLECDWLYGEHTVVGIEDNMYAKNEDAIRSEIEKCKIILETFPLSDSIDYDDAVSRVRATQEGREIEQSELYTRNDIFLRDASNFYVKNPFLRTAALAAGRHEIDIERYIANDDMSLISYSFDLLCRAMFRWTDSDIRATYVSFTSHAEAFLAYLKNNNLRAVWERQFSERKESVMSALDWSLTRQYSPSDNVDNLLDSFWLIALNFSEVDKLPINFEYGFESAYHKSIFQNLAWKESIAESTWFTTYIFGLNLCYHHLRRIGLTPLQRGLTCFLISKAAQTYTNTSPADIYRSFSVKDF